MHGLPIHSMSGQGNIFDYASNGISCPPDRRYKFEANTFLQNELKDAVVLLKEGGESTWPVRTAETRERSVYLRVNITMNTSVLPAATSTR